MRVVGTSQYQDTIWRIVGEPADGPDGRPNWQGEAILEPEPTNPHDPNAVRVVIDGQVVGYLDRATATRIQPDLLDRRSRGESPRRVPVACTGGFSLREGGRAHCGLLLQLD
jgi:hypothetical protein